MYRPAHFRVDHEPTLFDLVRRRPLGLLISHGAGGLTANPAPFLLDEDSRVLRGHLARENPQWRDFIGGADVLVHFSDADSYVSPSWYASKTAHGRVVPTWNYACVQVRGRAVAIEDENFIRAQITALTELQENDHAKPWAVREAPEDFVNAQMRAIIGVEIVIAALEGKWKVSQNRSREDRAGVCEGLRGQGDDASRLMADMVETPPTKE